MNPSAKIIFQISQNLPFPIAPAVDALLHIADNQIAPIGAAHQLIDQRMEILPLLIGGVLELVYHYMVQRRANLLEYEIGVSTIIPVHQISQEWSRMRQQELPLLRIDLIHRLVNCCQQPQLVQIGEDEGNRIEIL